MTIIGNPSSVRELQGFKAYTLNNGKIEVTVVPELGAKIISLKNLRTGREWLWHPAGGLNLFNNRPGDDFARSPLVGVDECLPTIAPARWQDRDLPDHGEVWHQPWQVDAAAWTAGVLQTRVKLPISPFDFERTVRLQDQNVVLDYRLTNRGPQDECFLWALHPLLRLQAGDQLQLPASTRALLNGAAWLDAVDSAVPPGRCAKLFARPVREGVSGIHNAHTGDLLEFCWNPAENNTLGLWLTRGGWHGHDHFALEPTNAAADALPVAAGQEACGTVPAGGTISWQIQLRLGT